tara:strand:- start:5001 stop:5195 length:195 start_codon:yes stop_codon:yes gene_type:complete
MASYHFGVPGYVIWTTHILVGLLFLYTGYTTYQKQKLPEYISVLYLILGVVVILYHGYLFSMKR